MEDHKIYIYESPDGGKTIYRREYRKDDKVKIDDTTEDKHRIMSIICEYVN